MIDHETNRLMIEIMTEPSQQRARWLLKESYSAENVQLLLKKALDEEFDSPPTDDACARATFVLDRIAGSR